MGLDQYAAIRLGTKDEEGNWEQEELAFGKQREDQTQMYLPMKTRLVVSSTVLTLS